MAAHLRKLASPNCSWPGCRKTATHQLYNTKNAPLSYYCKKHGKRAVERHKERHE